MFSHKAWREGFEEGKQEKTKNKSKGNKQKPTYLAQMVPLFIGQ
jgi:hypothetical protein